MKEKPESYFDSVDTLGKHSEFADGFVDDFAQEFAQMEAGLIVLNPREYWLPAAHPRSALSLLTLINRKHALEL